MTAASTPIHNDRYTQAGVNLDTAANVVTLARQAAQKTTSMAKLLGGLGGFSSAFELPEGYQQPVILTGCDGVGTKLKLAVELNQHQRIGVDLVAMSVNDILASGGRPLTFLDYISSANLTTDWLAQVFEGVVEGCQQSDCALVGGETAEMPGVYHDGDYDLAGFCIGIAEKSALLPKKDIMTAGDVVIGLASSGFHSNGYSLVRQIMTDANIDLTAATSWDNTLTVGDALLKPTRIYVKPVLKVLESEWGSSIKGMAHITGGGFYENLPRMVPEEFAITLHTLSWNLPPLFTWLAEVGNLELDTLYKTFNCGIGFAVVVSAEHADKLGELLRAEDPDLNPVVIGTLKHRAEKSLEVI